MSLNPDAVPLSGQVALVTGASRGLGEAASIGLARAGARVVLVARSQEGLDRTCSTIEKEGGVATGIVCDVTSEESVARMAAAVAADGAAVDILVNNAGVAEDRPFLDLTAAEFRRTLDVNVFGTFLVTQAIGRAMVERRSGKVITIGSVDALIGVPNLVHYCTSKGAIVQFTRALAAEWARYGVTVNCLCPGYFVTDLNRARLEDPAIGPKILRRVPLGRFGQIEEMVSWIVFLATRSSDYATGQVFTVDGGESAR